MNETKTENECITRVNAISLNNSSEEREIEEERKRDDKEEERKKCVYVCERERKCVSSNRFLTQWASSSPSIPSALLALSYQIAAPQQADHATTFQAAHLFTCEHLSAGLHAPSATAA